MITRKHSNLILAALVAGVAACQGGSREGGVSALLDDDAEQTDVLLQAFDEFKNESLPNTCVKLKAGSEGVLDDVVPPKAGELTFTSNAGFGDLQDNLAVDAGLNLKASSVKLSAGASYASKNAKTSYSHTATWMLRYDQGSIRIPQGAVEFNGQGTSALAFQDSGVMVHRVKECGTGYISSYDLGAVFIATLRFEFANESNADNMAAQLKFGYNTPNDTGGSTAGGSTAGGATAGGSGGSTAGSGGTGTTGAANNNDCAHAQDTCVSIAATFDKYKRAAGENARITLDVYQIGGDATQISKTLSPKIATCNEKNIDDCRAAMDAISAYVKTDFPEQFKVNGKLDYRRFQLRSRAVTPYTAINGAWTAKSPTDDWMEVVKYQRMNMRSRLFDEVADYNRAATLIASTLASIDDKDRLRDIQSTVIKRMEILAEGLRLCQNVLENPDPCIGQKSTDSSGTQTYAGGAFDAALTKLAKPEVNFDRTKLIVVPKDYAGYCTQMKAWYALFKDPNTEDLAASLALLPMRATFRDMTNYCGVLSASDKCATQKPLSLDKAPDANSTSVDALSCESIAERAGELVKIDLSRKGPDATELQNIEPLVSLAGVSQINFSGQRPSSLLAFATLDFLDLLDLKDAKLSPEAFNDLPSLRGISRLSLSGAYPRPTRPLLKVFQDFPLLERLDLSNNPQLPHLELGSLPELKQLYLSNTPRVKVSDIVAALSEAKIKKDLPKLQTVFVGRRGADDPCQDQILSHDKPMTVLKCIDGDFYASGN